MKLRKGVKKVYKKLKKYIKKTKKDKYCQEDFEVVDVVESTVPGYSIGCAFKYLFRYMAKSGNKTGNVEDLYKAIHYIMFQIASGENSSSVVSLNGRTYDIDVTEALRHYESLERVDTSGELDHPQCSEDIWDKEVFDNLGDYEPDKTTEKINTEDTTHKTDDKPKLNTAELVRKGLFDGSHLGQIETVYPTAKINKVEYDSNDEDIANDTSLNTVKIYQTDDMPKVKTIETSITSTSGKPLSFDIIQE